MKHKRPALLMTVMVLCMLLFGAVTAHGADDPVLSFKAASLKGDVIDSSIMEKYDLIWVNVWAEWCYPCVSEMPELQKIYKEYPNVLIIGAWVGDSKDNAIATAKETGVKYPLLNPYEAEGTLYNYAVRSNSIPASYFFDRNGKKIGDDYIGSRDYSSWKYIIDSLLKDVKPLSKPVIKKQPVSVTAAAGKKVTFKVKASGDCLKYQWYYRKGSGGKWKKVSGAAGKKAAYKFKTAAKMNKYKFRCCVRNSKGKVYSNAVNLKVKKQ